MCNNIFESMVVFNDVSWVADEDESEAATAETAAGNADREAPLPDDLPSADMSRARAKFAARRFSGGDGGTADD